jgi:hypothetical protein
METDVVHIRPARLKDATALPDVYAEAWRGAYRGIIPHLSLERMIAATASAGGKGALAERRPGAAGQDARRFKARFSSFISIRSIRAPASARSCSIGHGNGLPTSASGDSSFGRSPTMRVLALSISASAANPWLKAVSGLATSRRAKWHSPGAEFKQLPMVKI